MIQQISGKRPNRETDRAYLERTPTNTASKIPSVDQLISYLLSQPKYEHNFTETAMHFLGQKICL
jgi:hypothetical protein